MNFLECIKTTNNGGAIYIKGKKYAIKNESNCVYEVESETKYIIVYSKFATSPYYYGDVFKTME